MLNIYNIKIIFLLFICYSTIGWIIEVIDQFIRKGKIINRGFLIGPYCPIHGIGALLILRLLQGMSNSYVVLFIYAVIICTSLEYFTGFILEKIFRARWWDYSDYKFNLNGRVCLQNSLLFGLAGVLIVKIVEPLFISSITTIPSNILTIISLIMLGIFSIDLIISFNVICSFKTLTEDLTKDSTEDISYKVKKKIMNKSFLLKRLIKAFPTLKNSVKKLGINIMNIFSFIK